MIVLIEMLQLVVLKQLQNVDMQDASIGGSLAWWWRKLRKSRVDILQGGGKGHVKWGGCLVR